MNEWHLYSVAAADNKLELTSPKCSLKISGKVISEKDGLQLIQIASAVDAGGKPIHMSPNEVVYFDPERNLASFNIGRLQEATPS